MHKSFLPFDLLVLLLDLARAHDLQFLLKPIPYVVLSPQSELNFVVHFPVQCLDYLLEQLRITLQVFPRAVLHLLLSVISDRENS